jgi:hypothetical protein
MPSWETNCIEDWETKVDGIVDETINMSVISGIRLGCILRSSVKNPINLTELFKTSICLFMVV